MKTAQLFDKRGGVRALSDILAFTSVVLNGPTLSLLGSAKSWSSLDKEESLGLFLISFAKTTQLIVEWGSYLASQ